MMSNHQDETRGVLVSAIEVPDSDPNVRRIRAGNRTIVSLPARDVEELDLRVGQTWTEELNRRVQYCVDRAKAEKAALAMLGRRSYAIAELTRRLADKGYAVGLVDEVINRLIEDGWLDDRQHAEALLRESMRSGPASRSFLVQKLITRDVPADIAEAIVGEMMDSDEEAEAAIALARQKLRSLPADLSHASQVRRLASALSRKGFDDDAVRTALGNLGLEVE